MPFKKNRQLQIGMGSLYCPDKIMPETVLLRGPFLLKPKKGSLHGFKSSGTYQQNMARQESGPSFQIGRSIRL